LGNRSYRVVALALVLAALFLAPFVASVIHAQTIASGGQGVVFTKVAGVGGSVAFFFNLTSYTYTGPTTYIYLSPNGNPFLTMGDTIVSKPFSTVNVRYVAGNVTLATQYVENFINNLYGNATFPGATNAAAVYNSLVKYGWALVYLKISTGLPSPSYTSPAIAAGPFNLTLRPQVSLVPSTSYFAYYNCTVNNNTFSIQAYRNMVWFNITFTQAVGQYIAPNYSLVVTGASFRPASVPVLVYNYTKTSSHVPINRSQVFIVEDDASSAAYYNSTTYTLGIKNATISPAFVPPYLSQIPGTYLYGFNASVIAVNLLRANKTGSNSTFIYVPPPPTGYTVVIKYGVPVQRANTTVYIPNLTVSVTNVGLNPSTLTEAVSGWFDVLPSFNYTVNITGVAGPRFQLNPDDIVNLTFANLPAHTVFTSTYAVGNESILPSEPPAAYEWNSDHAATLEGFFTWNSKLKQIGNLTNVTGYAAGNITYSDSRSPLSSVAFLIPNAPFGLPYSYLGFYFNIVYTAELATGNVNGTKAAVYGDFAGSNCALRVYPFVQLETSNETGLFSFNTTALFGNYLLVRGFGFAPNSYAILNISNNTEAPMATAVLSSVWDLQTDKYGDFVYITQIPYSGSWVNGIIKGYPTGQGATYIATVIVNGVSYKGDVYANVSNTSAPAFNITIPYGAGDAIVYVNPTPTTYLNTTLGKFGGNLYTISLGGQILMPTTLYKFPYEATQLITNMSKPVIPASMGEIGHVVIVGGGLVNYPNVTLVFYVTYPSEFTPPSSSTPYAQGYFNVYPVYSYLTNGFADLFNVPVPDLAGNATYVLSLMNVTAAQHSKLPVGEPSATKVYIMTVDEVLANNFALAITVFNVTTPVNPLGLPNLVHNVSIAPGYNEYVYLWPPLTKVPWTLIMPGTQLYAYVFGSPVSPYFNTTEPIPFNVSYGPCMGPSANYTVGYIANGTLWSVKTLYYPGSSYKGATIGPLPGCSGLITLKIPKLTGTNSTSTSTSPAKSGTLIVGPGTLPLYVLSTLPPEVVSVSVVGSGSTANAGEPYMVLVPTQFSVAGLSFSQVQYFFSPLQVSVQAYVLSSANQVMQLPSSYIVQGPTIGGYQVYYITLPSNVTYGQLVVIVTGTTTYYFTGTTYSGEAAAEMGIVPPVNMTAISSIVSQAVKEIEANVTGEISQVESNMANYYGQLSQQLTTTQQTLATYILGNATELLNSIESVNSTLSSLLSSLATKLSGQITTAQRALSGYMAGNFSALASQITTAQQALSGYMAGNFSELLNSITSLNSTLMSVAAQLSGQITTAQQALSGYMAGNFSELLNSITSLNSTLMSVAAQLSGQITTAQQALSGYMAGNFSALAGQISAVQQALSSSYTLLSLQLAAVKQALATYIAGNSSEVQTALSLLGVQLSGQITTAQRALAAYMAGNFSAVLTYLSSVNSTLSMLSSDISQLSTITSNLEGVASQLSSINSYLASNFSAIESSLSSISSQLKSISSGISTLQGNLVALGAEVGSIGANVLELTKSVNTLTSYETAALNYLTSMNSTLGSVSSQLGSVSSTLSSVSSTVSSISSTLSGVSSSLGTISSDLSTVGSDLSSISGTLSSMSGTLSSVSSTVSSISSQLSSMSSTLSSTSSTASNAYSEATHAAQLAASAATYSLAALIVAIIALALIAYVAFAKM